MVKLERWSLHPVHLAYYRPIAFEPDVETGATVMVLRLHGEGAEGAAEVSVNLKWFGTTVRSLREMVETLLPMVAKLPDASPAAFATLAATIPENRSAKTLIDNALWDLQASAAGAPLWRSWNGSPSVAVSGMVTRQPPEAMAQEAAQMSSDYGYAALKFKGGQGFETDRAALRAVRRGVGDDVRVYVDANGTVDPANAPDYLAMLADEGAVAAEDPCRLEPDSAFAALQAGTRLPILVDSYAESPRDARLFQQQGLRALSLKPGRIGLSPCRACADLGARHVFDVHVGTAGESMLGTLTALQLAASLPRRQEWLPAEPTFFLLMKDQLLAEPLRIKGGNIELTAGPSVAARVDWAKVERLALH